MARIVERWPTLPPHIKAAVLALVGTAPNVDPKASTDRLDDALPPGFEKKRSNDGG